MIIIILAVFLVSTALVSVMYLANRNSGVEEDSWVVVETWTEEIWTDIVEDFSEDMQPTMTPEEAKEQLQEMFSDEE